ncbi:MAG: biotin--[acetyl-CoA-carboxylase] ligase [Tannerellaceae bacterium]|jgi:BirA family biotin operon repressor/biotin-[acetyl-CoA-carboxylase] ligase|nr:biotin--[acetyl-CoA-carboxylase] ligase [Tannerellaceae bacterium]
MNDRSRTIRLKETSSTNIYLSRLLDVEPLAEGTLVVAESQTAGRGQQGSAWESAPGENLTFSILLRPADFPAIRQFGISQVVSLAVKETLDVFAGDISVKWPNDIYWRDRKICGILIENSVLGQNIQTSVIGVGLNLNQTLFTGDAPNPVSLRQITGEICDREAILSRLVGNLFSGYSMLTGGQESVIANAYKSALYRGAGEFFMYRDAGGLFEACIHDVEPSGHLVLQLRNGAFRRYAFKEVSYA